MDERLLDLSLHRLNKANDDLESAETLFNAGKFAHSMSRSYYCMFDATRAILSFDKFDSKKHSGVISFFNRNYIKTGEIEAKYGKFLKDAEIIRLDCDYNDFYIADKKTAQMQLDNAKCFLEMVEKFLEKKHEG
jgi:uncharacterized protein (UPF0332 family)